MRYPSMLYKPAMEADDITGDVEKLNQRVSGGDNTGANNREIDTTNTDDIFGTKKKSGVQKKQKPTEDSDEDEDTGDDNADDEPDEDTEGANNTDDPTEDDDANNIDGDSELDDSEADNTDSEDDSSLSDTDKKIKLKNKMILLYNLFSSSVNTLNNNASDVNDAKLTEAFSKSKEYMLYGKNRIYDIITQELKKEDYPILLKKYIGLCRFHDVCMSLIDKSMLRYEESANNKVFTRKKRRSTK